MAQNKKFSALDGLDFSIRPDEPKKSIPKPTSEPKAKPIKKSTDTVEKNIKTKVKSSSNSGNKIKLEIQKKQYRTIRKQFILPEALNKQLEEEAKKLNISQNELINLLLKKYFE